MGTASISKKWVAYDTGAAGVFHPVIFAVKPGPWEQGRRWAFNGRQSQVCFVCVGGITVPERTACG